MKVVMKLKHDELGIRDRLQGLQSILANLAGWELLVSLDIAVGHQHRIFRKRHRGILEQPIYHQEQD